MTAGNQNDSINQNGGRNQNDGTKKIGSGNQARNALTGRPSVIPACQS